MNFCFPVLPRDRPAGFSLIELMVVLAIAAILLGIGVPSFRDFIQSQKITAAVNDFFASINLARSEAIQRGARVDVVPVDPDGDWAKGWVVFIDANNNQRPDADEQVIFVHDPVLAEIAITASMMGSAVQYIAYTGTGRTRTNASSQVPQAGNITFKLNDQTRKIIINFLGRPRVCNPGIDNNC